MLLTGVVSSYSLTIFVSIVSVSEALTLAAGIIINAASVENNAR